MDTEFQNMKLHTEPQDPESAPLHTIDLAIFEVYTPLTVEQMGLGVYKEDIHRMHEHYKKHKRDHFTNCNDAYSNKHYGSHLNRNRNLNPNFTTC